MYRKSLDQLEMQVDVLSKHRRKYMHRNEGFMVTSTIINYQNKRKNVQVFSVNWTKQLQLHQKKFKEVQLVQPQGNIECYRLVDMTIFQEIIGLFGP